MPEFSAGDIVRVVRQPEHLIVQVVGKVGFLTSLTATHAEFTGLNLDGSYSGGITTQLDCLEPETSPQWVEAKRLRDEAFKKTIAESIARAERYNARMFELSVKYGISVEHVKALFSDLTYLNRQGWWP